MRKGVVMVSAKDIFTAREVVDAVPPAFGKEEECRQLAAKALEAGNRLEAATWMVAASNYAVAAAHEETLDWRRWIDAPGADVGRCEEWTRGVRQQRREIGKAVF
jgi:hypothetical protein